MLYLHSVHHFVETHTLEPPEVDELMNLPEKACLVVLLGGGLAPEFIGNNLRQHILAEGRNAGDRGSKVGKRVILNIPQGAWQCFCFLPAFGNLV